MDFIFFIFQCEVFFGVYIAKKADGQVMKQKM